MVWSGWKTLIIPPAIALALYLGTIYFLLPLYRQRQMYSQYLPVALAPSDEPGIVSRTRGRIQQRFRSWAEDRLWIRRDSDVDTDFNFGDEELEEDIPSERFHNIRGNESGAHDRRLSRDLEAGFLDDDPDEEQEHDSQRRVLGRR